MALTRRRALQASGTAALAALAGCSTDSLLGGEGGSPEHTLLVESIDSSPVEHALYEPNERALFGDPARTALREILPDGEHETYGYTPLPSGAYVAHRDAYYQVKQSVTGRTRMERQLVRVAPVPEEDVPDDPTRIDSLARPSARVLKILHTHTRADGATSSSDLLTGDAYVLRRPAETSSALATGALDGTVVSMTDSDTWAYRVQVTREQVTEPVHTTFAVPVAESQSEFREVVFASRIDAELTAEALQPESRELLTRAIQRGEYAERAPRSDAFDALLGELGLTSVDRGVTGKQLWYDGDYYRYSLYVDRAPP